MNQNHTVILRSRAIILFVGILFTGVFFCTAIPLQAFAHPQFDERIEILNKKIAGNPNNAKLYLKRGNLYREHREWENALEDFRRARIIEPNLQDTDYYSGGLWLDAAQPEKAKVSLDRFLESNPNNPDGLVLRARAQAALGNPLEAAHDLDNALGLFHSPLPDLYLERARYFESAGPKYDDVRRAGLVEGVEHFGALVVLVEPLVELLYRAGNYVTALGYIERLPDKVRNQPKWLARSGDLHLAVKQNEQALEVYQRALRRLEELPSRRRQMAANQKLEASVRQKVATLHLAK